MPPVMPLGGQFPTQDDWATQYGAPAGFLPTGGDTFTRTEQVGAGLPPEQRRQALEQFLELAKKQVAYEPPPPPQFQAPAPARHPKIANVLNAFLAGFAATGDRGAQQALENNMRREQEREAAAQRDYQRRYQQWQTQVGLDQSQTQNGMAGLQAFMSLDKMLRPDPQDRVAEIDAKLKQRALDRPDIPADAVPGLKGVYPPGFMLPPDMADDITRAWVQGQSNERAAATTASAQKISADRIAAAQEAERLEGLQEQAEDLTDRAYRAATLVRMAKSGVQISETNPDASIAYARGKGLIGGPITPEEIREAWTYFPPGTLSYDDVVTILNTRTLPGVSGGAFHGGGGSSGADSDTVIGGDWQLPRPTPPPQAKKP